MAVTKNSRVRNLNVASLTEARKAVYDFWVSKIPKMSKADLVSEIKAYYEKRKKGTLPPFAGIYFYLIQDMMGRKRLSSEKISKKEKDDAVSNKKTVFHRPSSASLKVADVQFVEKIIA